MIGIKSGIKSIGLNAYAATAAASILAVIGVRGSLAAKYTATTSFLIDLAHPFARESNVVLGDGSNSDISRMDEEVGVRGLLHGPQRERRFMRPNE